MSINILLPICCHLLFAPELTLPLSYRPPRDSDPNIGEETVVPAGTPYLTKLKGQLVMVRHKKDTRIQAVTIKGAGTASRQVIDLTRPMEAARDFLGEAFGVGDRSQPKQKRIGSFEQLSIPPTLDPRFVNGTQVPLAYTAPAAQQIFAATPSDAQLQYGSQPVRYAVTQPVLMEPDFEQLKRIDVHYKSIHGTESPRIDSSIAKNPEPEPTPSVPIARHTCGNCGKLRSRRYYANHPIKPGDIPIQEFCAKCQRDASSTSYGSSPADARSRSSNREEKMAKADTHPKV